MKSKGSIGKILLTTFFALLPASGCTFFGSRGCHDDGDWCDDDDADCVDGGWDGGAGECTESTHCVAKFGTPGEDCAVWRCEAGSCELGPLSAGPAQTALQTPGDCTTLTCDGVSLVAAALPDAGDLVDDDNECTFESCDPSGEPMVALAEDGAECGQERVCQSGACTLTCVPQEPDACGDEGVGEPTNDTYEGASQHARGQSECAFLDGADVDWWTFYGDDDSFVSDELYAGLESDAEHVEVCAYVACHNGGDAVGDCSGTPAPEGGPGNGGCCWSGKPGSLDIWWDMYCTDTAEDAGTFFISVRSPGADACEPYVLWATY
jgi:hypothetical protein